MLPGAIVYTIAIAILSLISTDNVPKLGIDISDKLLHVIAYALLTAIWYFGLKINKINIGNLLLSASCIIYGIILEVIQGKVKTHRTADIYDVLANSIGVGLVIIVIYFWQRHQVKNT